MVSDHDRIDYVRLMLPFSVEANTSKQLQLNAYAEGICQDLGVKNTCYATQSYRDPQAHQWVAYWSIWGVAADAFFDQMSEIDFKDLLRIDYRRNYEHEVPDFQALLKEAIDRNSKAGTVKYITSPFKQNRNGRDKGGEGIFIGGEQSDRRLAIYRRGKEAPAIELQLTGQPLKRFLHTALEGDVPISAQHTLREKLCDEMARFSIKRLGRSPDNIAAGVYGETIPLDLEPAVETFEQLGMLWEVTDLAHREAFLSAVLPPHMEMIAEHKSIEGFHFPLEWLPEVPFIHPRQPEDDISRPVNDDGTTVEGFSPW